VNREFKNIYFSFELNVFFLKRHFFKNVIGKIKTGNISLFNQISTRPAIQWRVKLTGF